MTTPGQVPPAPPVDDVGQALELTRAEEELHTTTSTREAGRVRLTKEVDIVPTVQDVEVGVEQADTERIPAEEGDTGEVLTLPDGSVSVPVFEEELVITKRLVVRERIIVRKHTVSTTQRVQADLRRERVEIDVDPSIATRVTDTR